ncbi:MAG: RNA polymerase sigma factor FliA [Gallionella sp.]|nr:RNA polymerase sigma factor FliA [Gallionella sp.]
MYKATGLNDKEQCLREYSPLVKRLAHLMMAKLPSSVQIEDIIQAGMMGLLDAASRYDEFHGAQFETFATQRIRGAMLDELRAADWLPRALRRDMRQIETSINRLQQKLGRPPNETEIAADLEVSLAEYQQMLQVSSGAQLVYYEDLHGEGEEDFFERFEIGDDASPLALLEDVRFKAELARAIGNLPERERMVMGMIYEQEMNLREIGEVLSVGEPRVSQLHSQAVARLRGTMKGC